VFPVITEEVAITNLVILRGKITMASITRTIIKMATIPIQLLNGTLKMV